MKRMKSREDEKREDEKREDERERMRSSGTVPPCRVRRYPVSVYSTTIDTFI